MFSAKSLVLGGSLLLAASCLSTASQATNVLSDNFDSENGGVTALQYTNFTNFDVTGTGVDLVKTPDYGIICAGGSGSCVDLSGTPGPGGLISKLSYAFSAGDLVTLTFDISGNQRTGAGDDQFDAGFNLTGTVHDYTLDGTYAHFVAFGGGDVSDLKVIVSGFANGNSFFTYVQSFRATTDGTAQIFFSTPEDGNIGPLLDNVSLDITGGGVPEPATWAMLLLGMFGMGAMVRFARQRLAVQVA
jgi:hypothetical protein